MINRILHKQRSHIRVYVDDIVIFSSTLKKHLEYLQSVFDTLNQIRICLMSKKSYLAYSSVQLLKQQVNVLDLTIMKNKLRTITNFKFS